jgi:hypothetical protein
LITSRAGVLDALRKTYPGGVFDLITVGEPGNPENPWPDHPGFLHAVASELPQDLHGCCCLIGAGPWAELYCSWVRQRGGVGVDLGSGFDLLAGMISRPMHVARGLDRANPYALDGADRVAAN